MARQQNGWIGVDLDGTIAKYDGWQGPTHIGEPIPEMVNRVKIWLGEGKQVRIFTARVSDQDLYIIEAIEKWCLEHVGKILPITNVKDYAMIELWDDRAVQVIPNTGTPLRDALQESQTILAALYAGGVDNWEYYGDAMASINEGRG